MSLQTMHRGCNICGNTVFSTGDDEPVDTEDQPTAKELYERAREAIFALLVIDRSQSPLAIVNALQTDLGAVSYKLHFGGTFLNALKKTNHDNPQA